MVGAKYFEREKLRLMTHNIDVGTVRYMRFPDYPTRLPNNERRATLGQNHKIIGMESTAMTRTTTTTTRTSTQEETTSNASPPTSVPISLRKRKMDDTHLQNKKVRSNSYLTSDEEGSIITATDIQKRMRSMFPEDSVVSKPCMSARLFAAFSILDEDEHLQQISGFRGSASSRTRSKSSRLPVLALLRAFVHVECVSLGQSVEKRRVQFSGFDGSSTKPPRDSILGSHVARSSSIDAMVEAVEEVERTLLQENCSEDVKACFSSLSRFLAKVLSTDHKLDDASRRIRKACAKSMPFTWNEKRFQSAALMYKADIDTLLVCIKDKTQLRESTNPLRLEAHLATGVGRAIRYHLRRFFNPCYGQFLIDQDWDEHNNHHQARPSRISEMVEMTNPEWFETGNDTAVADGSISSVFAQALEAVNGYFTDDFLKEDFCVPPMPMEFCTSEASQRGLGTRKEPVTITKEDMAAILNDMVEAQRFLMAAKASKFIHELLNWPGVKDEVESLGGWSEVERYARIFHRHKLGRLSPNDAHLIMLSDVTRLEERVTKCWEAMEEPCRLCGASLDDLWARFDCSTKSRKKLQEYPQIQLIQETLADGLELHMFPSLQKVTMIAAPEEGDEGDNEEEDEEEYHSLEEEEEEEDEDDEEDDKDEEAADHSEEKEEQD